jgi:phospholipid N-methyltransferase
MVEPVRFDVDGGIRIVEFGPGTGPFTAAILQRLPADGSYVGIERDPDFVTHLRRRFPAAAFHLASAEEVGPILAAAGLAAADHIVSGLPFASLPRETTRRILDAVQAALAPGGTFTTFQYVHAVGLPPARAFREEMRRRFGEHRPARLVVRNLPPAFVLTWDKARSGV